MKNDKRLDTSYKQINTKKSFKNMIFKFFGAVGLSALVISGFDFRNDYILTNQWPLYFSLI